MTLVSIITPSFNQAAYLETCIRSVLSQDCPNLEYIIVDGGSTDGSVEIIKKYLNRLSWWVSEKDNGQAEAINKGLARARGEIVAWLNSDDYYLPGAVSAAVRALEMHPHVAMVYGDMLAVDESGQTINVFRYRQLTLEDLLCFQIIGQPAVFMRRVALEQAGGLDPAYHCLLDHHLWLRLATQGDLLHVPQIWAAARDHPQAKNRVRAVEFGREAFRILDWAKKQPDLARALTPILHRALASAYRVEARYLLDGGQPRLGLQAWTRALLTHPPTALARLNLLASALLELGGLGCARQIVLRYRRQRLRTQG